MSNRLSPWKIPARTLAAALLVAGIGVSSCTPDKPAETKVDPNLGFNFATVDYQDIIVLHPDYKHLQQIDEQIGLLEQEKIQLRNGAFEELQKKGASKMNAAVQAAKSKLENERAAIEGEMASLSASLSAQIEGEMRGVQAGLQDDLEKTIKGLQGEQPVAAPVAPPKLDSNTEGQISDYMQNLGMVRERNLAARRIELEKRVGDEVNSKKAEVDGQISAYEADLAAQYQSERLNLQLAAQNSVDEEARKAAEQRLGAITQEIDAKKGAKRSELESSYLAVRSEKSAALQSELENYQRELDTEVAAKVAAKRREIGGLPAQAPPQPRPQAASASAEVKAKIAQAEVRMRAELESKKAALSGQMEAKAAQAKDRLQAKQAQVEAELKQLEKEITEEIAKSIEQLGPETKKKIDANEAKVKSLQEQRKTLFEGMTADLNREIGEVAQKKNADMVVGSFEFSTYPDLTDQAVVAVKQMESSK